MIDPGRFSSRPWRPPPIRRVGEDGEPVGAAIPINGRDFSFKVRSRRNSAMPSPANRFFHR